MKENVNPYQIIDRVLQCFGNEWMGQYSRHSQDRPGTWKIHFFRPHGEKVYAFDIAFTPIRFRTNNVSLDDYIKVKFSRHFAAIKEGVFAGELATKEGNASPTC